MFSAQIHAPIFSRALLLSLSLLLLPTAYGFDVPKPAPKLEQPAKVSKPRTLGVVKTRAESVPSKSYSAVPHFKDCADCPDMVVIPGGSFTMGSPKNEEHHSQNEEPSHTVQIHSFAGGRYDVTRDEYAKFAQETGHDSGSSCSNDDGELVVGKSWRNPGFSQGGNHPVVCVSWDDAQAYVGWLSKKTGKKYRLLSEAEWEYAARAGTTTAFYTGDCINTSQANYLGNLSKAEADYYGLEYYYECSPQKGMYRKKTTPVGTFDSNGYGLYDMAGNVWQWTEDSWHDNYVGAPEDGSAWRESSAHHVTRGGSWCCGVFYGRSASRVREEASARMNTTGFRVARNLP